MLPATLKHLVRRVPAIQPQRSAMVFRRVFEPPRLPENATQEEINQSVFTDNYKHMRYRIVEETDAEPGEIKVILLRSSEDFGRRGQIITLDARRARQELLLPKLAAYCSPGNLEKYKDIIIPEDKTQFSSDSVAQVLIDAAKLVLPIVMSTDNPWTVEPWHIRLALLREGIVVDDDCIKLPEKPISGPDESIHTGEFCVTVTLNDMESLTIRCVLFQWAFSFDDPQTPLPAGWDVRFHKPIFPEDKERLDLLPRHKLDEESIRDLPDGQTIIEQYHRWKSSRDKKLYGV